MMSQRKLLSCLSEKSELLHLSFKVLDHNGKLIHVSIVKHSKVSTVIVFNRCQSWPGCSKLTLSLVNVSLKFQTFL